MTDPTEYDDEIEEAVADAACNGEGRISAQDLRYYLRKAGLRVVPVTTVDAAAWWQNVWKILHSLDGHEVNDVLDPDDIPVFLNDPHRFFIRCDDARAAGIWQAVLKRMPDKSRAFGAGNDTRLREALEFYRTNWTRQVSGEVGQPGHVEWMEPTGALLDDAGQRAAAALEGGDKR